MKKNIKISVIFVLVVFSGWVYLEKIYKPSIASPHHPSFDISDFHFKYYQSESALREALVAIFPIGTPKSEIDAVLGHFAEINTWKYLHPKNVNQIGYSYRYNDPLSRLITEIITNVVPVPGPPDWWLTHFVVMEFDSDEKLKKIKVLHAQW